MNTFVWSDIFLTGHDLIDEQHHKLIDLLNRFGDGLVKEKISPEEFNSLLYSLLEYTATHFQEEEKLMSNAGIDERHLSNHQQIHATFGREIHEMLNEVSSSNLDAARRLYKFLTHWLAYHILGIDQKMASQLDLIANGTPAEVAYELEEFDERNTTEPLLVALNGLFEEVSERNHELAELNRNLEERVAERTKELAEANQNLEALSLTDSLTNLPNRRHAMKQLKYFWQGALEHGEPLSCVMIDADQFKEINDTYGHDKGDLVLVELGTTLLDTFRNDDFVCRLGGDEFFVICPNTNQEGALLIAERVREKVSNLRVATGGDPWVGSVSMGVGSLDEAMTDHEALIKKADQGVYAAKAAGKNCVRAG